MGCQVSKARVQNGDTGRSMQDQARSFRAKVDAIKIVFRTEDSKNAFCEYMATQNLEDLPKSYFEIDEMLQIAPPKLFVRVADLVECYCPAAEEVMLFSTGSSKGRSFSKSTEAPESARTMVWNALGDLREADIANLDPAQVKEALSKSQSAILSKMTPYFQQFLDSTEHADSQKRQSANEKAESHKKTVAIVKQRPSFVSKYPRVLLVDAATSTLKVISYSLKKEGHEVTIVHNAEDAQKTLESNSFDLVLLDINLQQIMETLKSFRANIQDNATRESKASSGPLFIGMSSLDDKELASIALANGINAVINKPFAIDKLLEILEKLDTTAHRA